MSYKYVVGCGCSFLETHQPWFLSIPSERYVNLSKGGCGNEFIKHQLVFKISELISNNVNPKDIFVAAQWTGIARLDLYVQKGQTITPGSFHHDLEPTRVGSHVTVGDGVTPYRTDHARGFIHSGGGNNHVGQWEPKSFKDDFFIKYYKHFVNDLSVIKSYFDNVLFIQNLCKSLGIDYVMTNAWNPYEDEFGEERFDSKHFEYMKRLIDLDYMVYVKSNMKNISNHKLEWANKHGGMWQYLIERDGINPDNAHPSEYGQKIWGEYIVDELTKRKLI
tara:strand:- start:1129 stop:1959 length:831 start_codon:yes stop_codon:yes gene_type:complete